MIEYLLMLIPLFIILGLYVKFVTIPHEQHLDQKLKGIIEDMKKDGSLSNDFEY